MALACMLSIGVIGPLTKITQYTNMFKEIEKVMDSVSKLLGDETCPKLLSRTHHVPRCLIQDRPVLIFQRRSAPRISLEVPGRYLHVPLWWDRGFGKSHS